MAPVIRVALVGLGRMGRNWLRVLRAHPRFEVATVVDPVAPDATDRELFAADLDAAIVATPTPTHYDIARRLLGVFPVLVEKPLASTPAQCAELAAMPGLVVGHVERFNPAVVALAGVLRERRIGDPIHFSCTRVGGYPGHVGAGNNVLLDLAVHDLDILRTLLGPLRIEAAVCHATVSRDVYDTAEILLSSRSGASATVHVNWITPTKIRTLRVTGTRGVALVDLAAQTCAILGPEIVEVPVARSEPLRAQLDAFAGFCDGEGPGALCSGADASAAVLLAERAIAVGGRGEWA